MVAAAALVAFAAPAAASAHAYLVQTVPTPSGVLTAPPATVSARPTTRRSSPVSRSSRSPMPAAGSSPPPPSHARRPNPDTLVVPLQAASAGGLVPGLLAGDLRRRAPGAGRLHVRDRARTRARAAVRVPSISQTATAPNLVVARWACSCRDGRDRVVRLSDRDRATAASAASTAPACARSRSHSRCQRFPRWSPSRSTSISPPRSTRSARVVRNRCPRAAVPRDRFWALATSTSRCAWRSSSSPP